MNKEKQVELARMRVAAALENLNEAIKDAHRIGLRTRITSSRGEKQSIKRIFIMNPVDLVAVDKVT